MKKIHIQQGRKINWKTNLKRNMVWIGILILMMFMLFNIKEKEKGELKQFTSVSDQTNMKELSSSPQDDSKFLKLEKVSENKFPKEVSEREGYIREYLSTKYTIEELSNEEIENLIRIAKIESSGHDPKVEPASVVNHCKQNGKWIAVEGFSGCPEGTVAGRKEKSIGIFQILPSSFENYKCEGSILEVDDQLSCAVKIYKKSGFGAWFNSSKKLNLI